MDAINSRLKVSHVNCMMLVTYVHWLYEVFMVFILDTVCN